MVFFFRLFGYLLIKFIFLGRAGVFLRLKHFVHFFEHGTARSVAGSAAVDRAPDFLQTRAGAGEFGLEMGFGRRFGRPETGFASFKVGLGTEMFQAGVMFAAVAAERPPATMMVAGLGRLLAFWVVRVAFFHAGVQGCLLVGGKLGSAGAGSFRRPHQQPHGAHVLVLRVRGVKGLGTMVGRVVCVGGLRQGSGRTRFAGAAQKGGFCRLNFAALFERRHIVFFGGLETRHRRFVLGRKFHSAALETRFGAGFESFEFRFHLIRRPRLRSGHTVCQGGRC